MKEEELELEEEEVLPPSAGADRCDGVRSTWRTSCTCGSETCRCNMGISASSLLDEAKSNYVKGNERVNAHG